MESNMKELKYWEQAANLTRKARRYKWDTEDCKMLINGAEVCPTLQIFVDNVFDRSEKDILPFYKKSYQGTYDSIEHYAIQYWDGELNPKKSFLDGFIDMGTLGRSILDADGVYWDYLGDSDSIVVFTTFYD